MSTKITKFNKSSFTKFLYTAHLKTYAGTEQDRKKTKSTTSKILGHREYQYKEKDWEYLDNYAGHIMPPGKEIVYYKKEPVWTMSYQGIYIENKSITSQEVYKFLKEALRKTNPRSPFRGPKKYKNNNLKYVFKMNGNWKYFTGREEVYYKKKLIFFQDIIASIIK